jgi:hypothetical protein
MGEKRNAYKVSISKRYRKIYHSGIVGVVWRITLTFYLFIVNLTSIVQIIKKLNSVALVRERTIPTKRPPLVGKVSGKF